MARVAPWGGAPAVRARALMGPPPEPHNGFGGERKKEGE